MYWDETVAIAYTIFEEVPGSARAPSGSEPHLTGFRVPNCSVLHSFWTPTGSSERPAGLGAGRLALAPDADAVHEDVPNAHRGAVRRLECGLVQDGRRIEHREVGEHPLLEQAAVPEPQDLRGALGHLPHGLLEREATLLAGVPAEHAGEGAIAARVHELGGGLVLRRG